MRSPPRFLGIVNVWYFRLGCSQVERVRKVRWLHAKQCRDPFQVGRLFKAFEFGGQDGHENGLRILLCEFADRGHTVDIFKDA